MTMFMISKANSISFREKLLESSKTLRCECENKGLFESLCFLWAYQSFAHQLVIFYELMAKTTYFNKHIDI
jgi:hypothetical protein